MYMPENRRIRAWKERSLGSEKPWFMKPCMPSPLWCQSDMGMNSL